MLLTIAGWTPPSRRSPVIVLTEIPGELHDPGAAGDGTISRHGRKQPYTGSCDLHCSSLLDGKVIDSRVQGIDTLSAISGWIAMYAEYRTRTATAATTTATFMMLECHIDQADNAARDEAHAMANALLVMADSRHVSMPSVDGLSFSGNRWGRPAVSSGCR
jgi:hypothetical protein